MELGEREERQKEREGMEKTNRKKKKRKKKEEGMVAVTLHIRWLSIRRQVKVGI